VRAGPEKLTSTVEEAPGMVPQTAQIDDHPARQSRLQMVAIAQNGSSE
jgi:hypothetical protein